MSQPEPGASAGKWSDVSNGAVVQPVGLSVLAGGLRDATYTFAAPLSETAFLTVRDVPPLPSTSTFFPSKVMSARFAAYRKPS